MKEESILKWVLSVILAIIINQSFSVTEIVRQALKDIPSVEGYGWLHPFIILCFFLAETVASYGILYSIKVFKKLGLED
jgi:hypothetical protein